MFRPFFLNRSCGVNAREQLACCHVEARDHAAAPQPAGPRPEQQIVFSTAAGARLSASQGWR
jgi:hypothetical protein